MAKTSHHLLDTLDIVLLGTIGLGTIAWFARHQIANRLFQSNKSSEPNTSTSDEAKSPKKERNFVKVMQEQGRRVIFFYGSQTGTAEDYASRLAKECSQKYGVSAMTADIEQYDLSYLDTVPEDCLVFFVVATYGEGEPTDNAVEFWDLITDEEPQFSTSDRLENLRYITFGLGNKTYEHYNEVVRKIDHRLLALGAKRIGERGEGDDDGSLEEDFLAWQEEMWPAFCEALGVDEANAQLGPRQAIFSVEELTEFDKAKVYFGELSEWLKEGARVVYDAKRPYNAPITSRDLFKNSDRHCLHMEIDISDTNLSYQTGDHVAIWPTNSEVEVERLAQVLGLMDKLDTVIRVQAIDATASKQHPFPVPTTYRAVFRHYLDICAVVPRQTLMSLIEYAPTEKSKEVLRKLATDKEEYRLRVGDMTRNLGEVLEMLAESESMDPKNSFANVPFDLIVEAVSRLQPRYYSISSSSKEDPKKITVTAVTLQYTPDLSSPRTVYGVNTTYLWRLHEAINGLEPDTASPRYYLGGPRDGLFDVQAKQARVPVHVRRSQFKLPRNPTVPIIMVGPGTGVAPFRGFVRERALQKKEGKPVGTTVLFFGCRHPEQDFLYADEWPELFETLGGDSRLITAFSRETDKKVYVQHRLLEHGQAMWNLLEKGAYVYVCGDAKVMARDVNQTFVQFAKDLGGLDEAEAQDYVKNLRNTGRYQEDVWA
ncbi:NADPH-cytochrome P450 reductase [Rhizopus stolonifer]|uniref:NADPH--cytochrome P450 reductase n=1 Tax=Rhizopus stolonifer TaxID=4846 RepID=A0A367JGL6_RHIST|nr:NADPH-cytochrome P450 reductase [Rhizopus stolonifer]